MWFAWKFVPLWYQQQQLFECCLNQCVVICLKIRTFVVSATTMGALRPLCPLLWFAWKFVPLWYQQQPVTGLHLIEAVVICLKIRTFVVSATTFSVCKRLIIMLWFAWKFVPLWYQQQQLFECCLNQCVVICLKIRTFVVSATTHFSEPAPRLCCDLLENSYLCGISNNVSAWLYVSSSVVICLKIRTFVVSATTLIEITQILGSCDLLENSYLCGISNNYIIRYLIQAMLWFAWKFVPLWYQQQQQSARESTKESCDLLENSYLCGISNNVSAWLYVSSSVVICLKIRTFVVSATTYFFKCLIIIRCDLLENSYLCGISNNVKEFDENPWPLWFAWKFVPLWYQQQLASASALCVWGCDLLENSYLCGISNNKILSLWTLGRVVICLKIRTFVVSATTYWLSQWYRKWLWFAWKFVPLWYQQQLLM